MAQTQLNRVYVTAIDATGSNEKSLSLGTKQSTESVVVGGVGTSNNEIKVASASAGNITIKGTTNINGPLNVTGTNTLAVGGALTVTGQTSLGNASITGTFDINTTGSGKTTIGSATSGTTVGGSLTVNNVSNKIGQWYTYNDIGTQYPSFGTSTTSGKYALAQINETTVINADNSANNGAISFKMSNAQVAYMDKAGSLFLEGNASVKRNLNVIGTTTMGVTGTGALSATGLSVTGDTTLGVTGTGALTATGLSVTGSTTLNAITVNAVSTFNSGVDLTGSNSLGVGGTLTVTGKTSLGNASMTGAIDINDTGSGKTTIGSATSGTTVGGTLTVTDKTSLGNASMTGQVDINTTGSGITTIGSATSGTTVRGILTVNDNQSFANSKDITLNGPYAAPSSTGKILFKNDRFQHVAIDSPTGVVGNESQPVRLRVKASGSTFESITVNANSGNVAIGRSDNYYSSTTLDVSGTMTVTGTLGVTGPTSLGNVSVNGIAQFGTTSNIVGGENSIVLYPKHINTSFDGNLELMKTYGIYNLPYGQSTSNTDGGFTFRSTNSNGTVGVDLMRIKNVPQYTITRADSGTNIENTITETTILDVGVDFFGNSDSISQTGGFKTYTCLQNDGQTAYGVMKLNYQAVSGVTYKICLKMSSISFDSHIFFQIGSTQYYTTDYYLGVATVPSRIHTIFFKATVTGPLYLQFRRFNSLILSIVYDFFSIEPFYETTVSSLDVNGTTRLSGATTVDSVINKIGQWYTYNDIGTQYPSLGTSTIYGKYALAQINETTIINADNSGDNGAIAFKMSNSQVAYMDKAGSLFLNGNQTFENGRDITLKGPYAAPSSTGKIMFKNLNFNHVTLDSPTGVVGNESSPTRFRIQASGSAFESIIVNTTTGYVGIGGYNEPAQLLDVNGTIRYTTAVVSSDYRIKTNILDVEDEGALLQLRKLKPKTYTYKDTARRGTERVYGFIAQEVQEVLSYAGDVIKDWIPNIYEEATLVDDILTFIKFNTSDLYRDASGELFTWIKLNKTGNDERIRITEVLDEHSIKVNLKSLNVDPSGEVITRDTLFVYGQEVNDFYTLKKDAIWTVATAALQEVDRQLQAEKQKVLDLQSTVSYLQQSLATVLSRLDILDKKTVSLPEPAAEPVSEPVAEPASEPAAEPVSEPVAEPASEPVAEPAPEPEAEPATEPAPEPVAEPAADPATEPAAEPATEPAPEPVAEPAADPATEPAAEPAPEPVAEPAADPATEPAPEPVTEPAAEPVAEPATEPVTEPAAEPVAEPATESAPEPVTEPAPEPAPIP